MPVATTIHSHSLLGSVIRQQGVVGRVLRTAWKMSSDDTSGKDKEDGGMQMGLLLERMEKLRNQEEELQRAANKNWKEGRCSHK